MNGLILAAGTGSRLKEVIGDIPKGMIRINNSPIIGNQIRYFINNNFNKTTIITGFKHNLLEKALANYNISYLYNPFYSSSNNIVSVWMANPIINDDYICTYADLLYDEAILKQVLLAEGELCVAIDMSKIERGNCLVNINGKEVIKLRKEIKEEDADARFIGIAKISNKIRPGFQKAIEEALKDGHVNDYYTKAIEYLIDKSKFSVRFVDITGLSWMEIDDASDYKKALQFFNDEGNEK